MGQAKYGTSMESRVQWLRHLQEELLEAAIYIKKLIEIETSGRKNDKE